MVAGQPDLDYDPLRWHGHTVFGMRIYTPDLVSLNRAGDDWNRSFILDIDHIVDRISAGNEIRLRAAPADLIFRDIEMWIDWGPACGGAGMNGPSIDQILRQSAATACEPPYPWRIVLNRPVGGEIAIQASGFELNLR
jgi:hypothetical protein